MAIDEELSARVRATLKGTGPVREVRMFGGIGFMLNGNMVAGASDRGLLVRVGKERHAQAISKPGARPMIMRGRPMEGYVYVDPPLNTRAVQSWLKLACDFVQTLPRKTPRTKTPPARRKSK